MSRVGLCAVSNAAYKEEEEDIELGRTPDGAYAAHLQWLLPLSFSRPFVDASIDV